MPDNSTPSRTLYLRLLIAAPAIFGMIAAQAAGQQGIEITTPGSVPTFGHF